MLKEIVLKRNQLIDSLNELEIATQFAISMGRGDTQKSLLILRQLPYDPDVQKAIGILNEIAECDKILDPEKKAITEGLEVLDDGVKILILMGRADLPSTYKLLTGAHKANLEALENNALEGDSLEIGEIMKVDLPKAIALLERAAVLDCVDLE